MQYYCDLKRHLICVPYSIENLHQMAVALKIPRHWFHEKEDLWHYDIPKTRLIEIAQKCIIVPLVRSLP